MQIRRYCDHIGGIVVCFVKLDNNTALSMECSTEHNQAQGLDLLCFVMIRIRQFYPISSGLLPQDLDNIMFALDIPPLSIRNSLCSWNMTMVLLCFAVAATEQNTTKPFVIFYEQTLCDLEVLPAACIYHGYICTEYCVIFYSVIKLWRHKP